MTLGVSERGESQVQILPASAVPQSGRGPHCGGRRFKSGRAMPVAQSGSAPPKAPDKYRVADRRESGPGHQFTCMDGQRGFAWASPPIC